MPPWPTIFCMAVALLVMVEVAVLVPVIITQKQKDQAAAAARVGSVTTVFGVRVVRVINHVAYSVRRTASLSFLGPNATRNLFVTQLQFQEFTQIHAAPYLTVSTIYIWIPVVSRQERKGYEDFYGFPIRGLQQLVNATTRLPEKDIYIPFTLFQPPAPGSSLIGLDILDPPIYAQVGVLIRNGTVSYLVLAHASLDGKGPDRWGIFIGGYNPYANAYALGRIEVEGIVNEAVAVSRDQVVVGAWGDFPLESQQLLFKDTSPLLENVTSIRKFNESRFRDQFQTVTVDVFGDKILFAIAYSPAVYDSFAGNAWISLAVILSCVCAVVDIGVLLLILAWRHRVMMHRREQQRHADTQQMMSYVSHEIRNPLQSIIGVADLEVEKDAHTDESPWNVVLQSADAIECIANDVLDVRRIQEGQLQCQYSCVNVGQLFSDLTVAVKPLLGEGVLFSTLIDASASLVVVRSDVRRLRQILLNFLTNAAKFTSHGSISLEFAVQTATVACFSVRDTGRGIPEDKQRTLFRKFEQVQLSDSHRGFGLGLYLCRMLAKQLGLELSFASKVGVGTVFWLNVPLETPYNMWGDYGESMQLGAIRSME